MSPKLPLAVLAAGLAAHLGLALSAPPPEPPPPTADGLPPLPPPPDLSVPPAASFTQMVERPLFVPGRRPVGAPLSAAAAAAPAQFRLVGVVAGGGVQVALIATGAGVRRVALGQGVDGWVVASVAPRRVVLRRDGAEQVLALAKGKSR